VEFVECILLLRHYVDAEGSSWRNLRMSNEGLLTRTPTTPPPRSANSAVCVSTTANDGFDFSSRSPLNQLLAQGVSTLSMLLLLISSSRCRSRFSRASFVLTKVAPRRFAENVPTEGRLVLVPPTHGTTRPFFGLDENRDVDEAAVAKTTTGGAIIIMDHATRSTTAAPKLLHTHKSIGDLLVRLTAQQLFSDFMGMRVSEIGLRLPSTA